MDMHPAPVVPAWGLGMKVAYTLYRMNPSMGAPSKTSPSFKASSSSSTVMENLFRKLSMFVNHNWMILTLCSRAVRKT